MSFKQFLQFSLFLFIYCYKFFLRIFQCPHLSLYMCTGFLAVTALSHIHHVSIFDCENVFIYFLCFCLFSCFELSFSTNLSHNLGNYKIYFTYSYPFHDISQFEIVFIYALHTKLQKLINVFHICLTI